MGRPKKIRPEEINVEMIEPDKDWKLCFAAALAGLIARGSGMSAEAVVQGAKQYADVAVLACHETKQNHH